MTKKYLNWKALKYNKCPQCGKGLTTFTLPENKDRQSPAKQAPIICSGMKSGTCTFKIHESKMSQIVSNIIAREKEAERKAMQQNKEY